LLKFTFVERLKCPVKVCKDSKGFISNKNVVIGSYIYNSRGVSPRNIVTEAFFVQPKTEDIK
jgi:hypothetical protein